MTLHTSLLALPIVIPMFSAALILALSRVFKRRTHRIQRFVVLAATAANLLVALWILRTTLQETRMIYQMGLWPAPFGITIMADGLSAILLSATALLVLINLPFAFATINYQRERMGFYSILMFLLMGVNGAFLAGDFFNLYVFFEVMLMASFVLLTLGGSPSEINGGIRYVILNLLASTLLLIVAGVAYGTLGTLNLGQMAERLIEAPPLLKNVLAGLMLISFGSKAAMFPLHFWLPSSYHTTHPAITALYSGILTKVGIYTLMRIFPLLYPDLLDSWRTFIFLIAGLTMVIGVLGAWAQPTIRRLLSFHIVSQVGYMIMGIGLAGTQSNVGLHFGLAAGIAFTVHHMFVKNALMLTGGAVELEMGSGNLSAIGGMLRRRPYLATIFFFAAFGLAGFPPSGGFAGKLSLLRAALDGGFYWVAGASVLVSLLTTMSMVRIWQYAFWGTFEGNRPVISPMSNPRTRRLILLSPTLLVLLSLCTGIFFRPVLQMATIAATQASDRAGYIRAVAPVEEIPTLEEVGVDPAPSQEGGS